MIALTSPSLAATEPEMVTAQETFRLGKNWIHPKIIREFMPLDSDPTTPLVVSIDVNAATGSNRFFGEIEEKAGNAYFKEEGQTISYEWKGRLKNGMHVLLIRESGDGSLVSNTLGVFKLNRRHALSETGKKYTQLILEVERLVTLGDRAVVELAIKGNQVSVDVKCEKTCDSKKLKLEF